MLKIMTITEYQDLFGDATSDLIIRAYDNKHFFVLLFDGPKPEIKRIYNKVSVNEKYFVGTDNEKIIHIATEKYLIDELMIFVTEPEPD